VNESQALAAIRNALRLENLSRDLAAKVTPELALIFKNVRETLRTMPPEQIGREIRYRQLRLQLADMFSTANRTFYNELRAGLDGEVLRQVQWAADWLRSAEGRVEQELLAVVPRDGISVTTTAGMTGSYGGSGLSFTPSVSGSFAAGNLQFTRTQLVAITQRTQVLGKSLEEIFMPSDQMSVWIKDNLKLIDRVVKQGFLLGETNEEIAKQLPGVGQVAVTRNRAIARTAVMDMSQRAHEAFWDAQDEGIIQRWVFDATFDFRVCMQCAPWDGKEVTERSRLPQPPIHPNCRCRVLPVTATELELRRSGESLTQVGDRSYVEIRKEKPEGDKDARVYKTKAKVGGKRFYKVSKDIKPEGNRAATMADFLNKASPETRIAVMGKENARRFVEMVTGSSGSRKRLTPDEALREIVRNPYRRRK
jgi:Phage Mu protein F like protein